jgi:hypothetical protein
MIVEISFRTLISTRWCLIRLYLADNILIQMVKESQKDMSSEPSLPSKSSFRIVKADCTSARPCVRCSVLLVIQHRFDCFREQFGREPGPTDPLFFDPSKNKPAKASLHDAREQIETAANAVGINAAPVLKFLKVDLAIIRAEANATGKNLASSIAKSARSIASGQRRRQSKSASVWARFATNKQLHRLHNVTREELKTLSGIAMMGQVQSEQDMLYILDQIREAGI